jgi:peptidoglycan biosynthesis protein MviN/MurJ (putative lipid II flippase)
LTASTTPKQQILKSASAISVITVVSRVLGYVRDQRLTLLLGATGLADAFVLAYRIPNVLRRLFGEGSMTASFIPVFTDYMRNRSRDETWKFANRLFWTFSFVLGTVCWAALWYSHFASIGHFLIRFPVFSSLILGATLLYLALAWVFRCHEIHEVYGIAVRRDFLQPGKIGLTGSA